MSEIPYKGMPYPFLGGGGFIKMGLYAKGRSL